MKDQRQILVCEPLTVITRREEQSQMVHEGARNVLRHELRASQQAVVPNGLRENFRVAQKQEERCRGLYEKSRSNELTAERPLYSQKKEHSRATFINVNSLNNLPKTIWIRRQRILCFTARNKLDDKQLLEQQQWVHLRERQRKTVKEKHNDSR